MSRLAGRALAEAPLCKMIEMTGPGLEERRGEEREPHLVLTVAGIRSLY